MSRKRKRSSINERAANTDAVRSCRFYGIGAYKISDVQGTRFTETKPCDIILKSRLGRYGSVESKMYKRWATFKSEVLRPNQRAELDDTIKRKEARAFIFLFVRIEKLHYLVVFDWKEHKRRLDRGISITDMKDQKYGVWLRPKKVGTNKYLYNLKKLFSKRFK